MPDQILINQLQLRCHIGVPDAERAEPQQLLATIHLTPKEGFSGLNDEISRTIDYFEVCQRLQALAAERPRKLIETLATDFAEFLLREYPLASVDVEIRKFILPETRFVGVQIHREA